MWANYLELHFFLTQSLEIVWLYPFPIVGYRYGRFSVVDQLDLNLSCAGINAVFNQFFHCDTKTVKRINEKEYVLPKW